MIIRFAKRSDMAAVFNLIQDLAAFQNKLSEVRITVDDLIKDGFDSHPSFHCLVAEDEDEIIGIAFYSYRYSTWAGKTIQLDDLIVKTSKRGKGIGFQLFDELIKNARIENVRRVSWFVYDWNLKAIEFYKKSGAIVSENLLIMQIETTGS